MNESSIGNRSMIGEIVKEQRIFFMTGETRPLTYRINALRRLKDAIQEHEKELEQALLADLNKPASEAYLCEIGMVYDEISYHLKHLRSWVRNKPVQTPLAQFRAKSFVSPEPYGVVLIMAPWNYPVQLCFSPLVGAISAGNCSIVKPSAYAPRVSHAVAEIIKEAFSENYCTVVEGGRAENSLLLEERFDYIFFTGSVQVGKLVMAAAAKHLTPVSLELGGKSPVIVDGTANIPIAAKRIAFGKLLNAGQTCVAPDYVFVHKSVREAFVNAYRETVLSFFPDQTYEDMPHIINDKHYERLVKLIEGEKICFGGKCDKEKRRISPALIEITCMESPLMQEEIFGPCLPIIPYTDIEEPIDYIRTHPKPLALYLFTGDRKTEQRVLNSCSFGGGCINDTVIHLATPYMGFGGVGESGMGSYHGKCSFDTFSHKRSMVKKSLFPDLSMRYRPYSDKKDALIRRFLK